MSSMSICEHCGAMIGMYQVHDCLIKKATLGTSSSTFFCSTCQKAVSPPHFCPGKESPLVSDLVYRHPPVRYSCAECESLREKINQLHEKIGELKAELKFKEKA